MRSELAAMKSEIKARTDGSYYFPDGEGVDAFLERDDHNVGDGRSGEEEDLTDADIESAVKYRAEADDLDLPRARAPVTAICRRGWQMKFVEAPSKGQTAWASIFRRTQLVRS